MCLSLAAASGQEPCLKECLVKRFCGSYITPTHKFCRHLWNKQSVVLSKDQLQGNLPPFLGNRRWHRGPELPLWSGQDPGDYPSDEGSPGQGRPEALPHDSAAGLQDTRRGQAGIHRSAWVPVRWVLLSISIDIMMRKDTVLIIFNTHKIQH